MNMKRIRAVGVAATVVAVGVVTIGIGRSVSYDDASPEKPTASAKPVETTDPTRPLIRDVIEQQAREQAEQRAVANEELAEAVRKEAERVSRP